jgi:hypothetical protein
MYISTGQSLVFKKKNLGDMQISDRARLDKHPTNNLSEERKTGDSAALIQKPSSELYIESDLTAVNIGITVLWDVTTCSLTDTLSNENGALNLLKPSGNFTYHQV